MDPSLLMQNPYEEQQTALLERIIGNVDKLNEAVIELARSLAQINNYNARTSEVNEVWRSYGANVKFNLEQGGMDPPR